MLYAKHSVKNRIFDSYDFDNFIEIYENDKDRRSLCLGLGPKTKCL